MVSEESCNTEDWSKDAETVLKYPQIENGYFKL